MNWATRVYTLLLRLYPPDFHDEYGEEMTAVFAQALSDAQQQGRLALLIWYGRELTSLFVALAREQWRKFRREGAVMNPTNHVSHTLSTDHSKREAPLSILAGIFPFILFGLMFTLEGIDYHNHNNFTFTLQGDPTNLSFKGMGTGTAIYTPLAWMGHGIYGYLIVLVIALIGLGIGWARHFPRWSYAYLGVTVMSSFWLAGVSTKGLRLFGYTFGREHWGWWGWLPLLALTAVMLLLTRSIRPLVQLIRGIRRDWTLLSFALYAALSWLFLGVAYDNKTWYDQTLYLPLNLFLQMLAITGGAFFYMRGQRQWLRALTLPVAFILTVPISNLVTTLAGFSGASTTAVGQIILPLVWLGWSSVPLWPGLVSHAWQRFRPI